MPDVTSLSDLDATPHATVFERDPRTVRLDLAAGESVAEHSHPGTSVLVHVLVGRLTATVDGEDYDLAAGDVLRFSGDRSIQPTAETATTALVVLAPADG
ncbi:MAG: cupin domain-containing protein [Haloarculaceae archaeon]